MTTIYHNPRCSKSREALALLRARGVLPQVVAYLETPPDARALREITAMLGCSMRDIMRRGEKIYREMAPHGPGLSEDMLIDLVTLHPILLERPIVVHDGKAALGRPPEKVLEILEGGSAHNYSTLG
ncbi:MAG: arsenate reductase (glutaredoxin) [Gammaproteobacteria bacterium]